MLGTGHRQESLFRTHWQHALNYGGILRKKKRGRSQRPLSSREPLHLVLKAQKHTLRTGTLRSPYNRAIIQRLIKTYALRFYIKIEPYSIQGDHIHFLIRAPRRFRYQYFFRVLAGQIAQQFEHVGLLKAMTDTPPLNPNQATKYRSGAKSKNG